MAEGNDSESVKSNELSPELLKISENLVQDARTKKVNEMHAHM